MNGRGGKYPDFSLLGYILCQVANTMLTWAKEWEKAWEDVVSSSEHLGQELKLTKEGWRVGSKKLWLRRKEAWSMREKYPLGSSMNLYEAVPKGRVCKFHELQLWVRLSWLPVLHIVHVIINLVNQAVIVATISGAS